MPPSNRRSKLQFFIHLPSEIIFDILSRLPIRTIVICKSVCRSWRGLLCSREFIEFHLSKSVPGLVIGEALCDFGPKALEIYEFDDEHGLEHHHLHYKLLARVDSMKFLRNSELQGSANGLVLLHRKFSGKREALYVCNPITREYIELQYDRLVSPSTARFTYEFNYGFTYGFGVSKTTGQYKVVRILHERDSRTLRYVTMSISLVYTLGTGMWRSITLPVPFRYDHGSLGVCLNGNLHWLVQVLDDSSCIIRLDLETETFSTLSLPSPLSEIVCVGSVGLVVLGDFLCVSDNKSEDEIVVWLMKEYGDEKSWTKDFVISKSLDVVAVDFDFDFVRCYVVNPIKVFKDGDILIVAQDVYMLYYSNKTKTIEHCAVFGYDDGYDESLDVPTMKAMLHTSSFFSLSSFENERVSRC